MGPGEKGGGWEAMEPGIERELQARVMVPPRGLAGRATGGICC